MGDGGLARDGGCRVAATTTATTTARTVDRVETAGGAGSWAEHRAAVGVRAAALPRVASAPPAEGGRPSQMRRLRPGYTGPRTSRGVGLTRGLPFSPNASKFWPLRDLPRGGFITPCMVHVFAQF